MLVTECRKFRPPCLSQKYHHHHWKCYCHNGFRDIETYITVGTLRSDDEMTARTSKKTMGFRGQNNNFARASHSFCTFLCRFWKTTTWNCLIWHFIQVVNRKGRRRKDLDGLYGWFNKSCFWHLELVGTRKLLFGGHSGKSLHCSVCPCQMPNAQIIIIIIIIVYYYCSQSNL